ncbi:hypothetical protein BD414DRAFT_117136 [Trametes punicea]|nr:hypothetical protein BD414DRAFT_117136 [Trametes punicea]
MPWQERSARKFPLSTQCCRHAHSVSRCGYFRRLCVRCLASGCIFCTRSAAFRGRSAHWYGKGHRAAYVHSSNALRMPTTSSSRQARIPQRVRERERPQWAADVSTFLPTSSATRSSDLLTSAVDPGRCPMGSRDQFPISDGCRQRDMRAVSKLQPNAVKGWEAPPSSPWFETRRSTELFNRISMGTVVLRS